MKNLFFITLFLWSLASCKTDKSNFSTIQGFIQSKDGAKSIETFPLKAEWKKALPAFTPTYASKAFSFQTIVGDMAYLINGDLYQIETYNLQTQQVVATISFPDVYSQVGSKLGSCYVLNTNQFIWHCDSTQLFICNVAGQIEKTIDLPLTKENRNFHLASNPNSRIQFNSQSQTLIFPIQCIDAYDSEEEYNLPKFASYNLTTASLAFIPISLPKTYRADVHVPSLYDPFTAIDGQTFYAIFPLSNEVFSYQLQSNQMQILPLQFPVSLTSPAALKQPKDVYEINQSIYTSNHIKGFTAIKGKFYVQQVDAWNETLESKKFIDNTALFVYNQNGSINWGGKFLSDQLSESGIFNIKFGQDQALYFITFPKAQSSESNATNSLVKFIAAR